MHVEQTLRERVVLRFRVKAHRISILLLADVFTALQVYIALAQERVKYIFFVDSFKY